MCLRPAQEHFLGEEFAESEKLGLAPKVLQNLMGSEKSSVNRLFTM